MSAVLQLRLSSPFSLTAEVNPYDLAQPMVCEYEYEEGESPIFWPTERAHPGSPGGVQLLTCSVGGVDLYPMLKEEQIEQIEDALLALHE